MLSMPATPGIVGPVLRWGITRSPTRARIKYISVAVLLVLIVSTTAVLLARSTSPVVAAPTTQTMTMTSAELEGRLLQQIPLQTGAVLESAKCSSGVFTTGDVVICDVVTADHRSIKLTATIEAKGGSLSALVDIPDHSSTGTPAKSAVPISTVVPPSSIASAAEPVSDSPSAPSQAPSAGRDSTTDTAADFGIPRRNVDCSPGYVVQLASAKDPADFKARLTEMEAAQQLPKGAQWTYSDTAEACSVFNTSRNVLVAFAGPFEEPYEGCEQRLQGPPDAFIRKVGADDFVSCVCPAEAGSLPRIDAVGQTGVWVAELQRLLGAGLGLNVGSIDAVPDRGIQSSWGVFTDATADALRQFQANAGMPVTGTTDPDTWKALQTAICPPN